MSRRLIVEADGGSRGNPGPAGYGALVRDADTGELLVEVAEAIGTATNNVAEYEGLIAGLRAAAQISPDCTVEARMDSKLVVEQMSGRWSIKHQDMRRLAAAARSVIPPSRVRYTWVPRANNAHADRLANAAMDVAAGSARRPRARMPSTDPDSEGDLGVDRAQARLTAGQQAGLTGGSAIGAGIQVGSSIDAVDLGEPTTLILVRHGRTDETDRLARGGDSAGPALNAAGRRQTQQLAQLLANRGGRPSAIVSSPVLRAHETAIVLGAALDLEPVLDDRWAEVLLGDWDGLGYAAIADGWPAEYQAWRASTGAAPPGGESLDDVAKRADTACDRLVVAHPGQTVVVVSHTAPIRTVIARALDAGPAALWRLRVEPAAVSVVRFWLDGGCEVSTVNSVAHLA
jgi:probable phosphoglycerate mutase